MLRTSASLQRPFQHTALSFHRSDSRNIIGPCSDSRYSVVIRVDSRLGGLAQGNGAAERLRLTGRSTTLIFAAPGASVADADAAAAESVAEAAKKYTLLLAETIRLWQEAIRPAHLQLRLTRPPPPPSLPH